MYARTANDCCLVLESKHKWKLLTSPDVPGLLLVVSSPVPSSFRARRNSLLRSGPRRISFSLDGAMSMGGVVLEGCCTCDGTEGGEKGRGRGAGEEGKKRKE